MQNNELLYSSPGHPSPEMRFRAFMLAFAVYTPAFALFNAGGFLVIYFLGYVKAIPEAPSQLLAVTGISIAFGIAFSLIRPLLNRNKDDLAAFFIPLLIGLFLIGLNLVWSGLVYFLYVAIWFSPILQLWQAARTRQRIVSVGVGLAATAGLYFSELTQPYERMAGDSIASTFGMAFLALAIATLIILGLLLRVVVFRSLSTRLLASFIVIVLLPLIITATVSGISTSIQSQQQLVQQLDTISQLKQTQIEQTTFQIKVDLGEAFTQISELNRVRALLTNPPTSNRFKTNYEPVLENLNDTLNNSAQYQEFFILDAAGRVVISTHEANIGRYYSRERFFLQGFQETGQVWIIQNPFTDLSAFGPTSLMATTVIKNASGNTLGLAAFRSSFAAIDAAMALDPGIGETDLSYMVDSQTTRITPSSSLATKINTEAVKAAFSGIVSGTGTYNNNDGVIVIGAYRYIPDLNAAIITEITQEEAQNSTRAIIIANILLSILTASIAAMAVVITARTISNPITSLAKTVEEVSQGKLSERANIQREDEIGALANSFNSMADELQKLVTALEARVAARTQELEKQAARLRVASEVARDAASAPNLDELLNRSAQLILDRFGFYHTGIFLLDQSRTYAVLRASPTAAGQEMLARQYQLRVGETGMVGYVAATGEPRVALDTSADATYFRNPLLPNTRSELVLPLKAENRVIGVLDVQSEQPDAFTPEDIATLQVMADQLSTAIERVRLLEQFEQSLHEIERVSQSFTQYSWRAFAESQNLTGGYRFEGLRVEAISEIPPEARQALKRGTIITTTSEADQRASLAVPIKLRGQTIGIINVKLHSNNVPADTISMLNEAVARLGFALENSRLIAESQQRASRERAIATASAKIGASRETEQIMRSAVEELQRLLGDPEVAIQLKTNAE